MKPPLNPTLSVGDILRFYPDLTPGMHSPRVVEIHPQTLYKFSSQSVPAHLQKASAWWFTETEYQKVKQFMGLDSANPGYIARVQAGVWYGWSNMDLLLTATLSTSIRVFQGPGTWQLEKTTKGSTILFQVPQNLLQTYIPGLKTFANGKADAAVESAIQIKDRRPLPGLDAIDREIMRLSGKHVILYGNPSLH